MPLHLSVEGPVFIVPMVVNQSAELSDRLPRCREAFKHRVGQCAFVIALRHECTAVEDEKHEQHTTAEARASRSLASGWFIRVRLR